MNDGVKVGAGKKGKPQLAKADGGDWQVQVGAYKNPTQARQKLAEINAKFGEALAASQGHVDHRSGNYRVRFAGLSQDGARDACASIKAQGHDCMALRGKAG